MGTLWESGLSVFLSSDVMMTSRLWPWGWVPVVEQRPGLRGSEGS